jgi:3-oxoacyl-[acyl-carrier-protein] synthase II
MAKNRRVVITGIGVIAPNGIGKNNFWQANINGISGIDYIRTFDTKDMATKIAAEVKDFKPHRYIDESFLRKLDRFAQFGVACALMAKDDASLDLSKIDLEKVGVCIGSGLGGILFHEEQIIQTLRYGIKKINPLAVVKIMPNSVSAQISLYLKTKGPNLSISTACSSGLQAIGEAAELIRNNKTEIMITGGTEAPLTPMTFSAYNSMRVLSQRNEPPEEASCPFDRRRDGFVMGEAAGLVILESWDSASKRNANIYAEILGYAANSSAYHIVSPQPDGKDIQKVMALALKDAKLKPKDIDYINAHGTSTQENDRVETLAIKNLFGRYAYKLPISSTKSMIGHTIGAAGALGVIIGALAIKNNLIPPTINYEEPDPECDLNYVPNKAIKQKVNTTLVNSFGFGGSNASIILRNFTG